MQSLKRGYSKSIFTSFHIRALGVLNITHKNALQRHNDIFGVFFFSLDVRDTIDDRFDIIVKIYLTVFIYKRNQSKEKRKSRMVMHSCCTARILSH